MIANNEKPRCFFYAIWILLTCLCIPITFLLSLVILRIIIYFVGDYIYVNEVGHITEDYLGLYVFVPVAGLLTGITQYELLRRYLPRIGWWVLATTGGWLLGALLISITTWLGWTNGSPNMDLVFILMGLAIGMGQWLLLRQRLPRASWWIGANVLGWGLLGLISAGNTLGQFGLLTLGFLPACVTAAMLAVFMNQVKPTQPNGVGMLGAQSSMSGTHASVKVGFFIGQAIILLLFPWEVRASLSALPGFAEAQANEALIVALCANVPFVIVCEIFAWVAFVKKQTIAMLVATIIPLIILVLLVISGNLF